MFTCGFVSKLPGMISLNFGGFPLSTLLPKKPEAGLWLVEALAWYKGASERGAEHLSLLTNSLWEDALILVRKCPLSIRSHCFQRLLYPSHGRWKCFLSTLSGGKAGWEPRVQLPGEQPHGSGCIHHLTQVMRHSCSPLSALIFSWSAVYQPLWLSRRCRSF